MAHRDELGTTAKLPQFGDRLILEVIDESGAKVLVNPRCDTSGAEASVRGGSVIQPSITRSVTDGPG